MAGLSTPPELELFIEKERIKFMYAPKYNKDPDKNFRARVGLTKNGKMFRIVLEEDNGKFIYDSMQRKRIGKKQIDEFKEEAGFWLASANNYDDSGNYQPIRESLEGYQPYRKELMQALDDLLKQIESES